MTLEQLAYLAEIIGVVLIVVSLIYVARQLRQNNEFLVSQARLGIRWTILTVVAGLAVFWHTGEIGAQPPLLDTEVTGEGLHRVDPSLMSSAWVRPDVDLSRYTRLFFMTTVVQFRELPDRLYTLSSIQTASEFPVSDSMRARLREQFGESFYEAISGVRSHKLSRELGRDVLMVHGYLTDVITGVPPDRVGTNVRIIRWAWEANIIMEFRDSMSGELLARTVDHQRIEGPFDVDLTWGLAAIITRRWSGLLVRRLEELFNFYPSRLRRLQDQSELGRG